MWFKGGRLNNENGLSHYSQVNSWDWFTAQPSLVLGKASWFILHCIQCKVRDCCRATARKVNLFPFPRVGQQQFQWVSLDLCHFWLCLRLLCDAQGSGLESGISPDPSSTTTHWCILTHSLGNFSIWALCSEEVVVLQFPCIFTQCTEVQLSCKERILGEKFC